MFQSKSEADIEKAKIDAIEKEKKKLIDESDFMEYRVSFSQIFVILSILTQEFHPHDITDQSFLFFKKSCTCERGSFLLP